MKSSLVKLKKNSTTKLKKNWKTIFRNDAFLIWNTKKWFLKMLHSHWDWKKKISSSCVSGNESSCKQSKYSKQSFDWLTDWL